MAKTKSPPQSLSELLIARSGEDLRRHDTTATPGFTRGKEAAKAAMPALSDEVAALQERLYAEADGGGRRSVLLVVQGMDTSGKGGIMRHVVGAVDPQGIRHTAFKAPTAEEREHDFLWRIRRALPAAGEIGVFDRSHYEDVLIVRVEDLVPEPVWRDRYAHIRHFEDVLADAGTSVVKVFLHISKDEQAERFRARLDTPEKRWKFSAADLEVRARWDRYQEAYEDAINETSTERNPWYVVPADRKWFRDFAVSQIVRQELEQLPLRWPKPDYDPRLVRIS